ncbi:MAG: tRNA lysidine(34) synthetase TilS [Gemmatimonadaceae bacterium]
MPAKHSAHESRATRAIARIETAVRETLHGRRCVLLAISGGIDSMVLLDAAARAIADRGTGGARLEVATFDHGTGVHSRRAARLVAQTADGLGLTCTAGAIGADTGAPAATKHKPGTEAYWREARWRFLRSLAAGSDAPIATAHTRDDQIETVAMRILRGAGARGLAGLHAGSGILRPLLDISRSEIETYAILRSVAYAGDPSNRSRKHFRNRVRLDLLPAVRRVRPGFDDELLAIAAKARDCRRRVEQLAGRIQVERGTNGELHVATAALSAYSRAELQALWPALAATAGVTLDRRGTTRCAAFTRTSTTRQRMQISGGWEVVRDRHWLTLRRSGEAGEGTARHVYRDCART